MDDYVLTSLQWTSVLELGHAAIDEQHRRLLLLGEDLTESTINLAANELTEKRLQALNDFTEEHFAFEEDLMRSTGYPGVAEHANFHGALLAQLSAFSVRMRHGTHTDPVGLHSFFSHWIIPHIRTEDRDLVIWLKSHEPDGGG